MRKIALGVVMAAALLIAPAMAMAAPAVIINDFACGLLDGDGNYVATTDTHSVITNSPNGNVTLVCKVRGVPNSSGKAVQYDTDSTGGTLCGTPGGLTSKWQETVSASGNATLTCHLPD